jgi:hypothetical protein
MKTGSSIIIVSALVVAMSYGAAWAANDEPGLLFDGYALNGAEGTLVGPAAEGKWLFELEEDVNDGKAVVQAGKQVELLPSSGLERLIADANSTKITSYRLWGRVTKYRGRNFIFPMQYLALGGAPAEKPAEPPGEKIEEQQAAAPADANDVVTLPVEVLEQLRSRRVVRTEQLTKPLDIRQDSILADRTGFISDKADGRQFFTLDSLGRNVTHVSFRLLPCEALEKAEDRLAKNPEHVRMKVAGVLTRYNDTYYLLLQRANRVYSYGNFGR